MTGAMTDTLDSFRAAVMADPEIQFELARQTDIAEFERVARAWAGQRGLALGPDDFAGTGPDPVGLRMIQPAPLSGPDWPALQWLPLRFAFEGPGIDWCHFAGEPLAGPFYHDTVRRIRERPFNQLFRYRTPLETLTTSPCEGLMPQGFIYHMSRCGSTLVSQMLAAVPGTIMASEPGPLDTIVQLPLLDPRVPPEFHVEAVRAMVRAIGRDRSGSSNRYFLKLDSWHTLALPLFRAAFPEVPWIFLYRDPVEVLVSQLRARGPQTEPGVLPGHLFGFAPGEEQIPDIDYVARVLAATCGAVLDCWGMGGGMLVDYRELPGAMFDRILPHFGYAPGADELALMQAASSRDAKAPSVAFTDDREAKHREADESVRAVADRYLAGVYARLQELRTTS